ncbi:MAG: glycosyltransferase family 2 protein [Bacilli bacterium]|nr:glycosyltransferase family 2 protein [Bacilli bacterium]
MNDILHIVVPCYNEEEVIENSIKVISEKLNQLIRSNKISKKSKIVIVDDGSKDNTINIVKKLQLKNKFLMIIKLSRNFGHQFAMYAGIMETRKNVDMIITMDADLQDDINAIDDMIDEYYKGNEIVYGVRNNRDNDSWFKRNSALVFYKVMSFLGGEIINNHADFRLMSKRSLEELSRYEESNLFIRGIIPKLGFQTSKVYYKRLDRKAGSSKYNLRKMLGLAIDGITSFSIKPIRFIIGIGIIFSFLSFIYLMYVIISYFRGADVVNGWVTIIALVCFFGSFQIFCIGVIGEYISKIYLETKRRPKYIIDEIIE